MVTVMVIVIVVAMVIVIVLVTVKVMVVVTGIADGNTLGSHECDSNGSPGGPPFT